MRSAPASALLALIALSSACSSEAGDEPPSQARPHVGSALLVTLDTTRHDAVGAPGTTPVLDALAREGEVFERCRTVAPLTLPSHASMLTGLYPPRHGIRDNGHAALPDDATTLAERARGAGLRTAAFVAAVVLDRRFGLDQGFEVYAQPARPDAEASHAYVERPARDVVREAAAWLGALAPEERFLAWVHLFDPHAPYRPEPELAARAGGDAYLGEVAAADRAVGELLDALRATGRLDSTVVVVVADHGEDRMQHGEPTHASFCYDTTLRVPLLVRWPDGRRAGTRTDAIASVVDVYPTLLAALGLEDGGDHDGLDLGAGEVPADRGVYFETYYNLFHYGWSPLAGWVDARGKYVHSSAPELYRPREDPGELDDVAGAADAEELARYVDAIARVEASARDAALGAARAERDEELLRGLRGLGYAGGESPEDVPSALAATDLPAPATRLAELHAFLEASELSDAGRCEQALPLFERVTNENPANRIALDRYAYCLIRVKDWARAADVLRRRVAAGDAVVATHVNLGVALQNLRRREEALAEYRRALELDPAHPAARTNLARLLDAMGRTEEAAAVRAAVPH